MISTVTQVYIDDPLRAPTVLEAQDFFTELGAPRMRVRLKSKEGNHGFLGGCCDVVLKVLQSVPAARCKCKL